MPGAGVADIPVTTPVGDTVAIAVLLLAHVPLPGALLSAVVDPWHTLSVPPGAAGRAFTDITTVVLHAVTGAV